MFGRKLKFLRQQRGLTQNQLAKKLGISTSAVGMYEQDRREPDNRTLLNICKLFEISTDYLLKHDYEYEESMVSYDDLSDIINNFENTLLKQQDLKFNGVILSEDDVGKIVDVIRIGAEFILKNSKNNQSNQCFSKQI